MKLKTIMKGFPKRVWALAVLAIAVVNIGSTAALAQTSGPIPLTLINGWVNANAATGPNAAQLNTANATVEEVGGIVQFRGGIENPTNFQSQLPFVLPASLSPATDVYIPVNMLCLGYPGETGRLHIQPNGTVDIERKEGTMTLCFTSLDGASFAQTAQGFTPLTLINGWTNSVYNTSNPGVQNINGIVHFQGAIQTSSSNNNLAPFVLPPGFRPAANVFIPVDLYGAHVGRLNITPDGTVQIQAEPLDESGSANPQAFTSLDGAWFAATDSSFTPLTLVNGWTNAPFNTSNAAAASISGIVYLEGAIANGTANPVATLPPALRPLTDVYLPVDLCGANDGWIQITAVTGELIVNDANSAGRSTCFTSLDGLSFVE